MTNKSATAMVAAILKTKLAGADVDPEALQAAIGVGGGAGAPPSPEAGVAAGGEEAGIQQLLASLSPEELEQLAASLAADIQNPQAGQGGADVAALAQAIESHLGQSPEAEVAGAAPEKAAELKFIKSAGYISGFLTEVMAGGADSSQAVDLYDQALSSKLAEERAIVKQASARRTESAESVKLAAYFDGIAARANELGFSEAQTVTLLKAAAQPGADFMQNWGEEGTGAFGDQGGSADLVNAGTPRGDMHDATGVILPTENPMYDEAGVGHAPGLEGIKQQLTAAAQQAGGGIKGVLAKLLGNHAEAPGTGDGAPGTGILGGLDKLKDLGGQGLSAAGDYLKENPNVASGLGGAGLAAGLGLGAYGVHKFMHRNDNKHEEEGMEAQAAYYDGVFKRAQEYGFSRDEAIQLIQNTGR